MFGAGELQELKNITAGLAQVDALNVPVQDLLDGVLAVETAMQSLLACEAAVLVELDVRGLTDAVHGMRTAKWLARETGIAPGTAGGRLKLARRLRRDLPETEQAVRDGRLSPDRARVMVKAFNPRIVDEFRAMQESLIEESASMTYREWAERVEILVELLDQDGPTPRDDIDQNRLSMNGNPEAGLSITAKLFGDLAITAQSAIEQLGAETAKQFAADAAATDGEVDIPSESTCNALGFVEACRRALMVDAQGNGMTRPRTEASFLIVSDDPDTVYLDGKPLVKGSWEAMRCDMDLWTVVLNSLGVPMDMGREIRNANKAQKRAMRHRDGGCVFPGCTAKPSACEAHHIAWWYRDLGTTAVRYMVLLCRHHHRVLHRNGWSITLGDDGWAWITTPSGTTLWGQRHGTTRSGPPPPPNIEQPRAA